MESTKSRKSNKKSPVLGQLSRGADYVLISPRVTEKAALSGENNVYVFNVSVDSNKIEIKKAIEKMYKVVPTKVRTIQIPARKTFKRGRRGTTPRAKKAYVYLKKGDSITIV